MRCYIASPFFNAEQLSEVEEIKKILEELKVDYFSPKDFFVLKPNANKEDRLNVIKTNKFHIQDCDFMICNTNNKDIGTIWESGWADREGKRIIYFNRQFPTFNVMLSETGYATCNTYEELKIAIARLISGKDKIQYEGLVQ